MLVNDPLLRTSIVAGEGGLHREVAWAHTCEVADPWNWLGSGDLLMTDGYSFPSSPTDQCAFIANLATANIAGLALGEGFVAPPLTADAQRAADELDFPVLQTARPVPFVTIARAVASAVGGGANSRASRVLRLYDILRRAHGSDTTNELLLLMGRELKATLHVIELSRGRPLLAAQEPLPDGLLESIFERVRAQQGRLSAFNRVKDGDPAALLVPIGTRNSTALVVRPHSASDAPDLMLTQHAAMIAELEVERRAGRAARDRARAAGLMQRMLDGAIDPDAAASQLRAHGLGGGPWTVVTWGDESPQDVVSTASPLSDPLAFAPWPFLHTFVDDTHVLIVAQPVFDSGLDLEELGTTIGVSQPFSAPARFADAVREARWALESALQSGARSAVYGSRGSYFMPSTVAEGQVAVQRLLGPIIAYDTENNAQLLPSLETYFEVNRSWVKGARRLRIHKQTLAYRIHKIEQLTGADLRDFGVQTELYLALRTYRLLGPSSPS